MKLRLLSVADHSLIESALGALGFNRLAADIHDNHLWLADDKENALMCNAWSNPSSPEFAAYVLKDFDVNIREMMWSKDANIALRGELIRLRDTMKGDLRRTKDIIVLSHTIGWLANFVRHVQLDAE